MDDPFDPPEQFFLPSEQFPPPHAENSSFDDDILQYLNLSDREDEEPLVPASPLPLPQSPACELDQLLCTEEDSTLPNMNVDDVPMLEGQNVTTTADRNDSGKQPCEAAAEPPLMWTSAANLDCSCCFVLREVVHSNGLCYMKLALHGGLGVFDHATLDISNYIEGFQPTNEQFYVELSTRTYDWVKNFLVEYGITRKHEKLIFLHDTMSAFFDALCVRMNYDEATTSAAAATTGAATTSAVNELPGPGLSQSRAGEVRAGRPPRTAMTKSATQRQRTKNLTLDDLEPYFHLPIAEAAKLMDLCATALKKSCRKHGLPRWPYRKVRSIDKAILTLQDELNTASPADAMRYRTEICKLRKQRARVCAGLSS